MRETHRPLSNGKKIGRERGGRGRGRSEGLGLVALKKQQPERGSSRRYSGNGSITNALYFTLVIG